MSTGIKIELFYCCEHDPSCYLDTWAWPRYCGDVLTP